MKEGCLFCQIAYGHIDSLTIYEDDDFIVILDKFPGASGHTLILTKKHVETIFELDEQTAGKLFALTTIIAKALKKSLGCEGMNLLQNNGAVAGQMIHHFHLHLIPRFENDGMKFAWETKALSDEQFQEIASLIIKEI